MVLGFSAKIWYEGTGHSAIRAVLTDSVLRKYRTKRRSSTYITSHCHETIASHKLQTANTNLQALRLIRRINMLQIYKFKLYDFVSECHQVPRHPHLYNKFRCAGTNSLQTVDAKKLLKSRTTSRATLFGAEYSADRPIINVVFGSSNQPFSTWPWRPTRCDCGAGSYR